MHDELLERWAILRYNDQTTAPTPGFLEFQIAEAERIYQDARQAGRMSLAHIVDHHIGRMRSTVKGLEGIWDRPDSHPKPVQRKS